MDQGNAAGDMSTDKELASLKARISMVFENHQNQTKVINQLYRMFIPDWEKVNYIEGHPHCGEELWKFVCQLFLEFDRNHHPESQPGGIWNSWGFIMNTTLGPWEVSLNHCQLNYCKGRRRYGRDGKF